MPSQLLRKKMDAVIYQAGTTQSIKVPRGDVIRKITLAMTQQPTIAGGSNTPALAQPGDGFAAISQLQLTANGSDILWSVPGLALKKINQFLTRQTPLFGVSSTGGNQLGGSGANPQLFDEVDLPFECPINQKPADTWLWTAPLTQLDLRITWAANAAAVNSAASAYTTNPVLNTNYLPSSLSFRTDASGSAPLYPPLGMRVRTYQQNFAGLGTDQRIDLDAGRFAYRGLIIQATTNATPAVDTAALFSNLRVQNGTVTIVDIDEPTLNADSYLGNDRGFTKTAAGVLSPNTPAISASTSNQGWYFLDFCPDGRNSEAVATNGNDRFSLFFNTPGAVNLSVYAIQLLPLVNGNPSP